MDTDLAPQVRLQFRAAMTIFLITVVIGIVNGLDLVEFGRNTLLTHVHAGTLGWITLAVFGAGMWLFSEKRHLDADQVARAARLAYWSVGAIAAYVITFFLTTGPLRPAAGSVALIMITAFFAWVLGQVGRVPLTVARLAMLGALASLVIGGVLGVFLGLEIAGLTNFLPPGAFQAHPAAMVIGYLILAGMAISEWWLMPREILASQSRTGVAQVACMFLGGMSLMVGALLDVFLLIALNLPLEVAGVVIFLIRLRRAGARVEWSRPGATRFFGLSVAFLVLNVALIAYVIANYADDISATPTWLIFALDHSMFIGVMTNALFGLVYVASSQRRAVAAWADEVVSWGVNVGLVGFVIGLMLQEPAVKRLFSAIMGIGILTAIALYVARMQEPTAAVSEEAAG
jgi:hypothetical protein